MIKWIFIGIEAILYGTFLWIDMFVPNRADLSIYLKYTGILLCFFYVLFFLEKEQERKDATLLKLILLFTLISDTFLLLVNNFAAGITTFVVAQLLHRYRLHKGRPFKIQWIILSWLLILGLLHAFGVSLDYVLVIAIFYFLCMVSNAGYSLLHRENLIYSIGLTLFLCCDLNVGLFNVASYITVPEFFTFVVEHVVSVLIWFFYLPSQVLIALSATKDRSRFVNIIIRSP